MSVYLATLDQARSDSKLTSTTDDAYLLSAIGFVSNRIETAQGQWYEPRRDTLYFDALRGRVSADGRSLDLNMPLVELYGVTLGDGTVMDTANIRLYPRGETPAATLFMTSRTYSFLALTSGEIPEQAISVEAAWCYHSEYNTSAWVTGSTLSANTTSSATSLSVASVTLFSVGQLIRIGTEYLRVTAKTTTPSAALTVERGINGTTAAAHTSADVISIFNPEPAIQRAALRWAGFLLARRAAYERVNYDGINTTTFPPDMPDEVKNILKELPLNLRRLVG